MSAHLWNGFNIVVAPISKVGDVAPKINMAMKGLMMRHPNRTYIS